MFQGLKFVKTSFGETTRPMNATGKKKTKLYTASAISAVRCLRSLRATRRGVYPDAMKKILVAADVDRSLDERARGDARFEVVRRPVRTEAELADIVGDAEVLVTRAYNRVTRRVIDVAPK